MQTQVDPASQFQVVIAGEIVGCKFLSLYSFASVSYKIYSPNLADWSLAIGEDSGVSARGRSSCSEIVWNLPISCTFCATNPAGWPRLVLTLLFNDWFGREVIGGYGSVTIPCQPGRHVKEIQFYAPMFRSSWLRLINWVFGKRPILNSPVEFLTDPCVGQREQVITSNCSLSAKVNINISLLNTDKFKLLF